MFECIDNVNTLKCKCVPYDESLYVDDDVRFMQSFIPVRILTVKSLCDGIMCMLLCVCAYLGNYELCILC